MEEKKINRIIAGIVFLISAIVLAMTTQVTVPFWDCGERLAAAYLLQIPHPPGTPFHALLGRIFLMIPFHSEIAFRMNFMSTLFSAGVVTILYLSSVIIITKWRGGEPKNLIDRLITYGSSAIGALTFSFSDTFWFNAVESETYSLALFIIALVVWLALYWWTICDTNKSSERIFILIGYLFGLSIGVHQLSMLGFFTVALIYYFKKYDVTIKSFTIFAIISTLFFVFMYKGIMTGVPAMLGSSNKRILLVLIVAAVIYGLYFAQQKNHGILSTLLLFFILMVVGYSTYTMIVIRANKGLAMNENNPSSFNKLPSYLGREQYGSYPFINFDKNKWGGKLFPRRWSDEPHRVARFRDYKSDWDYFVKYQFYNMWFRYLLFNFVGRTGDVQDAPSILTGTGEDWIIGEPGQHFPNKYYAIPFIIGLLGALYHLYRDRKIGVAIWSLFVITGFGLMVYQNMQNPQPRERDYFFVGSFYVFAIWVGLGVAAILELIEKSKISIKDKKPVYTGLVALFAIIIPGNMLVQNFDDHNRHGNHVAWDLAYNLLQSCPPNAILFTQGDNDTFPVWYLQDVEGVRRDVRLVNLSLINTDWYALQMKNETPYGAMKVPMSYKDEEVRSMVNRFHPWEQSRQINLPVSKETYKKFLQEEYDNSIEGTNRMFLPNLNDTMNFPQEIKVSMNATISLPDNTGQQHYGVKAQDIFTLDIIKTNNWERPICFSITCDRNSRIGIDNYLMMEGLTLRLVPFRDLQQGDFINAKAMWQQLTNEPEGFYKEPAFGYKFRNLNDPNIYLGEQALRLVQNYRSIFVNLATYFINHTDKKESAIKVLNTMNQKISDKSVPMDYRLKYNMVFLYDALEQKDLLDAQIASLEKDCLYMIEQDPRNVSAQWNPYRILIDIYEISKQYDKEIDLLRKIEEMYPNDPNIKNRIEQIKKLKSGEVDINF
jgi:tetratricopeptide (TPR) repeat protein